MPTSDLVYSDANDLWLDALDLCLRGQEIAPRGQACFEQRCLSLELRDPSRNVVTIPQRKLSYHFMVAEWLWVMGGCKDVATIAAYNKNIAQFSDDGIEFFGAYGPRLYRDFGHVVALLKRDPDSRQAVINIWRPEALHTTTKDVPCTLTWQFFIRNRRLEMHACMRSNDVWLGLPYDLFNFTQIQRYLASCLRVDVGPYTHTVGSLHLYEHNKSQAEGILRAVYPAEPSPVMPEPTYPEPFQVEFFRSLLTVDTEAVSWARVTHQHLPIAWQPYLGVLIHKFSKDPADLSPPFTEIICSSTPTST